MKPDRQSQLSNKFENQGYILPKDLDMTLQLMDTLSRPLLIEGDAGVGKTELAQTLAKVYATRLIRLQCYEGLDAQTAVYEWNYAKQLLAIKQQESKPDLESLDIFNDDFLLSRPLLQSLLEDRAPVLLIDEIDRADEAFEAFLLELLSEFKVSIPELGTIKSKSIPYVILTSNGTRELSDALRRRCLYYFLPYPDPAREKQILRSHIPDISDRLAEQITVIMENLRAANLKKAPGIAESIDWAKALTGLDVTDLTGNKQIIVDTRSCFIKTQDDLETFDVNEIESTIRKIA